MCSALRPGGWIEFHDIDCVAVSEDGTTDERHPLNVLYALLGRGYSTAYGWDLRLVNRLPGMLQAAGFVNIQVRHNLVPVGRWHQDARMREMGLFSQTICQDLAIAVLGKHDMLGISETQADDLFHNLTTTLDDTSVHSLLDWVDVWAQKPLTAVNTTNTTNTT